LNIENAYFEAAQFMQDPWPTNLPILYPDVDVAELCAFLSDQEYQRIKQLPLVAIFPLFASDGESKTKAFGAGLAHLIIRDLMLVRSLSVRGPEDTPNVPRDEGQETSLSKSLANTICIGGEFSTQRGFRLECDLWKNGSKVDQLNVSDVDFHSFLQKCAETLAVAVGGEVTPELRQQWSVSRPLTPSSLVQLGQIRLAFDGDESDEKNRLVKKAISKDAEFALLYCEIDGEDSLKAKLKAYKLDPYDA